MFPSFSCLCSRLDRTLVPLPSSAEMRSPGTASEHSLSAWASSATSSARARAREISMQNALAVVSRG